MSSEPDSGIQKGQQIQIKLGFYSVALTFTILGLAIQTASFGANVVADLAELLAWLILLLSGLNGLSLLERMPHVRALEATLGKVRSEDQKGRLAMRAGLANTKYRRHKSAFV